MQISRRKFAVSAGALLPWALTDRANAHGSIDLNSLLGELGIADDAVYIAMIGQSLQLPFWQAVRRGAQQAAAELKVKVTFEAPQQELSAQQQIALLDNALGRNPDVLAIAALDPVLCAPLLLKARSDKTPVIAFASPLDPGVAVSTIVTDNVAAASLAGDVLAARLGGAGEVAVLISDPACRNEVQRRDGFAQHLLAAHPGVRVVAQEALGRDPVRSAQTLQAMLQKSPGVRGLFACSETSATGILPVLRSGKRNLCAIGFDSGRLQTTAIRDGVLCGAVSQNPFAIGYLSIQAAAKAARNARLPVWIDPGFFYYDQHTVDDARLAANLYG